MSTVNEIQVVAIVSGFAEPFKFITTEKPELDANGYWVIRLSDGVHLFDRSTVKQLIIGQKNE
jgi:hypothetical protein